MKMTREQFEREEKFSEYHEPKVPLCFIWVFNCFLEIYNGCGEGLTWTDILNYGILRDIRFTQTEIDLIWKMNSWAEGKKKQMREEE